MGKNTFEVGTMIGDEWNTTLLENVSYSEAVEFCFNYEGSEKLWLYDTSSHTTSEFYQYGKQL